MQVGVLGPLDITLNGTPATPSAPKLRSVLALLALRANTIVGTHQIIEELWGENPPPSATTTLQTYIYQLRKLLCGNEKAGETGGGPSGPVLRTSFGGYRLDLSPDALDAQRFTSAVNRGRAKLADGDTEAAAEILREALAMWRGPTLADVARGPQTDADVVRLEEMRNSALESRIAVDLRLGRHNEVISELTGIVAQHPTHEGFQAKLMQALYSAGRRSEALGVFQRARAAMADQLGLEPSNELRELQRHILAGDAPPAPEASPARVGTAPDSLPLGESELIGREAESSALLSALRRSRHGTVPVVAVSGAPGSGKTAFTVRLARDLAGDFPDGLFYVRMVDSNAVPISLERALGELLAAVGLPHDRIPAGSGPRAAAFREWSARRKALVLLDDMPDAERLAPMTPTGAGSALIVIGRRRMADIMITDAIDLPPLNRDDSHRLIARFDKVERLRHNPADADELIELCGGLPKALYSAMRCYQRRPHWNTHHLMHKIRQGGEDILSMREAVSTTLAQIGPMRQRPSTTWPALSAAPSASAMPRRSSAGARGTRRRCWNAWWNSTCSRSIRAPRTSSAPTSGSDTGCRR